MSDEITNPFAKKMYRAESELKDDLDVESGEQLVKRDYAAEAAKQASAEFEKIKEHLAKQADECNRQRPEGYPQFRYIPSGRLDAGKFAITLQPQILMKEYLLTVCIGWHPNAAQFVPDIEGLPPIRSRIHRFQAHLDDAGFSWLDLQTGEKYQAQAKIVAGSKALHHVLTELIPPIDREYTIRFFFHHKSFSRGDEVAFHEMFPYFCRIAIESREKIERRIGQGMNSSVTKVIDNAIVGFVRTRLRVALDETSDLKSE
jgi:hypothetical protein